MWEGQSSPAGLTFSHVLGIVRNQVIVHRWEKAWDGLISWLSLVFSLVHRSPTVPTSADCVCVYGYLLPKCTIWEKESMSLCLSLPPMKWLTKSHSLPSTHTTTGALTVWRDAIMHSKYRNGNMFCCAPDAWGKALELKRQGAAFQLCSFALNVLACCHKNWLALKSHGVSHL